MRVLNELHRRTMLLNDCRMLQVLLCFIKTINVGGLQLYPFVP